MDAEERGGKIGTIFEPQRRGEKLKQEQIQSNRQDSFQYPLEGYAKHAKKYKLNTYVPTTMG
jgi:hypothetical protein